MLLSNQWPLSAKISSTCQFPIPQPIPHPHPILILEPPSPKAFFSTTFTCFPSLSTASHTLHGISVPPYSFHLPTQPVSLSWAPMAPPAPLLLSVGPSSSILTPRRDQSPPVSLIPVSNPRDSVPKSVLHSHPTPHLLYQSRLLLSPRCCLTGWDRGLQHSLLHFPCFQSPHSRSQCSLASAHYPLAHLPLPRLLLQGPNGPIPQRACPVGLPALPRIPRAVSSPPDGPLCPFPSISSPGPQLHRLAQPILAPGASDPSVVSPCDCGPQNGLPFPADSSSSHLHLLPPPP